MRNSRSALAVAVIVVVAVLSGCSSMGVADTRKMALIDARLTLAKVTALAVNDAIGHTASDYEQSVARGTSWPKPAITANGTRSDLDSKDLLPIWVGVSFGVSAETPDPGVTYVNVNYAVPGQGSSGGGFNSRLSNVVTCVQIRVRFDSDVVDTYSDPSVSPTTCSSDVKRFYGASESVALEEVQTAGD